MGFSHFNVLINTCTAILSEQTQLSRLNFYNTFEDKEAMYLAVLPRFGARMAANAGESQSKEETDLMVKR